MLYAMLQSRLVCTKACYATEWALLAMVAYLAAEETSCNPVCLATEQAVIAVRHACLALLMGMPMVYVMLMVATLVSSL